MNVKIRQIVYEFAERVRTVLGDKLEKVLLYGSYARGDYNINSDIDVMLLVNIPDIELTAYENDIADIAFDMELTYGIHISPVMKNENHFDYWSEDLPFYRNVKNEGVLIDG